MHRVEAKKLANGMLELLEAADGRDLVEPVMLGPSPTPEQLVENNPALLAQQKPAERLYPKPWWRLWR
jgi:hypothetical protein